MTIQLNGQPLEIADDATVADLLTVLGLDPRQCAVERNLELAPRTAHAKTQLAPGDRVEIVTLVGGG
ncbi:MAG: sulfur carrier protein ThiS [Planctomycetales bacterium]|nr:sulfur carrier protein ThiS [Planctomycetales bacterium]